MKCKENPENLISLLYNEIDKQEKKRILAHMESCPSCKKTYKELMDTIKLLAAWEDKEPEMDLVFTQKPEPWWKKITDQVQALTLPKKISLLVPAGVLFLLLLLSIFNFQAQKIDGDWTISFSLFPHQNISSHNLNTAVQKAISNSQEETIQVISELLQQSQYAQKVEFTQTLNDVTEQLQSQRLNDLRMFYQDLADFHQVTENNFSQEEAINEV
jgi:hypothetical protein